MGVNVYQAQSFFFARSFFAYLTYPKLKINISTIIVDCLSSKSICYRQQADWLAIKIFNFYFIPFNCTNYWYLINKLITRKDCTVLWVHESLWQTWLTGEQLLSLISTYLSQGLHYTLLSNVAFLVLNKSVRWRNYTDVFIFINRLDSLFIV